MTEKINELLNEKINEIFLQMQEENGIKYGDISPWDAIQLETKQEEIASLISIVLEKQKNDFVF